MPSGLAGREQAVVKRERYSKKECRERGQIAVSMLVLAMALLTGTLIYVQRQIAVGRHAHVGLNYVLTEAVVALLATWLTWDWARYKRRLNASGHPLRSKRHRGHGRKRRE